MGKSLTILSPIFQLTVQLNINSLVYCQEFTEDMVNLITSNFEDSDIYFSYWVGKNVSYTQQRRCVLKYFHLRG